MRTILFTFRMQQSIVNARVLIITLALVLLTICLLTYIPEVQNTMASVNSWRNVSAYHLLKMHLSARPSHVTSLRKSYCRTLAVAKFNESLLNFNQVQFHQGAVEKMKHLNESESWKKAFHPMLNRTSKMSLLYLYDVFQNALDGAGITHILMHGSAVGAWRHHGITPWDDDIDIAIDVKDWHAAREVLSCISGYSLDASSNSKWAFFKIDSLSIQGGKKRWPFLDLFLYTYDDDYVWSLNYLHLRKFVFPKEDMFPIQYVPFECFLVPVPRHLRKVLQHQYIHPEICTSHYTNHMSGKSLTQISRPCKELRDLFTIYDTYN